MSGIILFFFYEVYLGSLNYIIIMPTDLFQGNQFKLINFIINIFSVSVNFGNNNINLVII